MDCLVSIIIPVYQVEKYISDTILSVCRQTYKNIEIILVDNNTKDQSISIASSILEKHCRNYRIIKQYKQGLAATRNAGFKNAKGEWAVSIDSDDTISPIFIEELLQFAISNDLSVVTGRYKYVDTEHLFDFDFVEKECYSKILSKKEVSYLYLTRKLPIMITNTLFKKSFLLKNDLSLDEDMKFGADLAFMWKVISCSEQFGLVYKPMYNYYNRPDSLMTAPSFEKINSRLQGFEKLTGYLRQNNFEYTDVVYARELFGLLATVSQYGDYSMVKDYVSKYYNKNIGNLLSNFPDNKVRIMNCLLRLSPRYYHVANTLIRNKRLNIHHLLKNKWNLQK